MHEELSSTRPLQGLQVMISAKLQFRRSGEDKKAGLGVVDNPELQLMRRPPKHLWLSNALAGDLFLVSCTTFKCL